MTRARWVATVLSVAALAACASVAPVPIPEPVASCAIIQPLGAQITVGPLRTWLPAAVTSPVCSRATAITEAIAAHLTAFAAAGYEAPVLTLVLSEATCFPEHGLWSAYGYYCRSGRHITCWVGGLDEVPALFHELCHAAMAQRDFKHEDPRWTAWGQTGDALAARLRAQRATPLRLMGRHK